ncbi:ABC transporter ATP-binding protein [soil metagenome]
MSDILVSASGLSKRFKIYEKPTGRLTEWATMGRASRHRDFWALRDFSFDVRRGQCIGIIGANGAGKSTLLRILSRTLAATSGTFTIDGRLLSLLELGTGFNPNLSGRLNVLHTAELLGYSPAYAADKLATIETFADLGEFFDLPLRMYSSGMQVRLGFSMFAALDPEILVVDEALAVGDASFQRKCFRHMEKMVEDQSRSVLLVAHDMVSIQKLCSHVIWLDHGKIRLQGEPKPVVEAYMKFMFTGQGPETADAERSQSGATAAAPSTNQIPTQGLLARSTAALVYPGESVELQSVWVESHAGKVTASAMVDQPFSICYAVRFKQPVPNAVFGVRVSTIRGELLVATNTVMMSQPIGAYEAGQTEIVRWPIKPGLAVGEYFISCGVSTVEHPYQFLTREVDAYRFAVDGQSRSGALCSLGETPLLGGATQ